jgi:hypothetical protein
LAGPGNSRDMLKIFFLLRFQRGALPRARLSVGPADCFIPDWPRSCDESRPPSRGLIGGPWTNQPTSINDAKIVGNAVSRRNIAELRGV